MLCGVITQKDENLNSGNVFSDCPAGEDLTTLYPLQFLD